MADLSTLQQSLINAKKVMNKVDGGNFSKGNGSIPQENLTQTMPVQSLPEMPRVDTVAARRDLTPKANITEEKINNSKLPDVVKKAMINNPIPEIPFNKGVGLSEDFLSGVKEQMKKQDIPVAQHIDSSTIGLQTPTYQSKTSKKLTSSNLKSIIKESVRELITEIVDDRIEESVNMKSIEDENFQFKVGNRIFYGKITASKPLK